MMQLKGLKMNKSKLRKQAGLALIISVMERSLDLQSIPDEIKILYSGNCSFAKMVLKRQPFANKKELNIIADKISAWEKLTGWENKVVHPCTGASFLCLLAKHIGNIVIEKKSFKIYKYYMDIDKVPVQSDWAGRLAFQKWLKSWGLID